MNGILPVMIGGCRPRTRDLRIANGFAARVGTWISAEATVILTMLVSLTCITSLRTDRSISCFTPAFGEWKMGKADPQDPGKAYVAGLRRAG